MNSSIWLALKRGDTKAFKSVYQNCYQELYMFGFRVTADKEKVKDAIHEMFCEIWQKRHHIAEVNHVNAYLKTYLKRKLLKDIVHNHQSLGTEDLESDALPTQHSYEYLLIQSQTDAHQKEKIFHALSALTPSQREIIQLKFYEGYNYEQIANLLGLKTRTVYNHVYEALCILKQSIK